jgi:uncharacterized protein YbjT (DUF2867 family)
MAQPWEQCEGEPDAAYVRFLVFRNLGPTRTLTAAQATYRGATERNGSQAPSGTWTNESAAWSWVQRADAWDVATLTEAGQKVVAQFLALLSSAMMKAVASLERPGIKPLTVKQALEVIGAVGNHVTPELVGAAQRAVADAPPPGADDRPRLAV